ncbi:TetR/AcrR family transcriptional regulator [Mycolicibacterium litorale]|uniref:TetR family transcriptional regulator n=1 Tax=Mycolicibacterium litorale TaxID=758802 RepID=A0AAD1MUI6_9MYCO|nr:TetR family transcriptional regulator [Mycolicibacterium litorale]MCV7415229.1 TetR/AcrR family transcriptional regulator [Mycolicibacterium litorale]TDY08484.1 TetR family transcriptional regulator [Mycolicibacterium litorale]BBY16407.1 TetR family transcriptional regulator [Mycolicibacterium litorale]
MPKRTAPGPRDERGVLCARILAAARTEFAEHGVAGTTIRAVARSADVDPALVYHYFGSKDGLLDAATDPPQRWLDMVAASWATPRADLGRQLVSTMLSSWADEEIAPTLRAVIMTAAHDARTRAKLGLIVERSLIGASTLATDEADRLRRSGLVASQLIGFALVRFVWKIEPIASMPTDEVVAAVAPNLQRYIDDDLG